METNGSLNSGITKYVVLFMIWSIYTYHSRQLYMEMVKSNQQEPSSVLLDVVKRTVIQYLVIALVYIILFILMMRYLSPEPIKLFNAYEKVNVEIFSVFFKFLPVFAFTIMLGWLITKAALKYTFKQDFKLQPKETTQCLLIVQWLCISHVFLIYTSIS